MRLLLTLALTGGSLWVSGGMVMDMRSVYFTAPSKTTQSRPRATEATESTPEEDRIAAVLEAGERKVRHYYRCTYTAYREQHREECAPVWEMSHTPPTYTEEIEP